MSDTLRREWDRLEEARRDLFTRLESATEEELASAPGEGKWSPLQVMSHLTEAEAFSLSYVRRKLSDPDRVPRAGFLSRLRSLALQAALLLPIRIPAPARVADPPTPENFQAAAERWIALRDEWRTTVEQFPSHLEDRAIFLHLVAGRMSLREALRFHRHHLLRHSRQIDRAITANRERLRGAE
jgi:hypothetical protein